jgi:hypothetical protein
MLHDKILPRARSAALAVITVALTMMLAATAPALAASSPTVATGAATAETQTSAVLNGVVNPNGAKTTYYFQWGTTQLLGQTTKAGSTNSGTKNVSVKSTAAGLTPGTVYYYRLVASNSSGTSTGQTRSFKTQGNPPPGASTGGASAITRSSATLSGVIYPNNETTYWYFEYGLTSAYSAETLPQAVGGAAPVAVNSTLKGLEPGAVFHYRLVVEHATLSTVEAGSDQVFQTHPSPRPRPRVTASSTPRTARAPATITTTGQVHDPRWILSGYGCTGTVRITLAQGRHVLRTERAAMQPNCSFAAATRFTRRSLRGHALKLTVRVRFLGNSYLAPSSARNQTVSLH